MNDLSTPLVGVAAGVLSILCGRYLVRPEASEHSRAAKAIRFNLYSGGVFALVAGLYSLLSRLLSSSN